jgi:hypothetical protein
VSCDKRKKGPPTVAVVDTMDSWRRLRSCGRLQRKGILDDNEAMVSCWQDSWEPVASARCQGAENEATVASATASRYVRKL